MQTAIGYILIIVGVLLEIIAVLAWVGILRPTGAGLAIQNASQWDVLLALVRKLPWVAIVGLLDIYAGLKLIGVALPL